MSLYESAVKYGSDKAEHGYCEFYEKYLSDPPKKLLEIGVFKGSSIRMWKEYFPNTEIHGLDLFEENPIPDIPGVTFHKGHQCDWQLLEQLRKENFDVIIDDGSHASRDQLMTFFGLFNGGRYFIEDTHCAFHDFYRQGLPEIAACRQLFSDLWDSPTKLNIINHGNITLIHS